MDTAEELLTVAAVARLLHFDCRTIRRMCESGELAAAKIRGRWRITPAAIRTLVHPAKPEGLPRADDTAVAPRNTYAQEAVA